MKLECGSDVEFEVVKDDCQLETMDICTSETGAICSVNLKFTACSKITVSECQGTKVCTTEKIEGEITSIRMFQ